MTLRCSPVSGHLSVYWYQQALNQGPQFLFEFYDQKQSAKVNFSDRFSAQHFSNSLNELTVKFLELRDSALYLCASSLAQPCWVTSSHPAFNSIETPASHPMERWRGLVRWAGSHCQMV